MTKRTVWKSLWVLLAATVVVAVGGYGWLQFAPRQVPAGQAPLATLTSDSFRDFKANFDAPGNELRLLALFSPT